MAEELVLAAARSRAFKREFAKAPDYGVLVSYPDSGRVIYISLPATI